MKKNDFWLSICIPAYEHPEGVLNILDAVCQQNVKDIEIIISDDSLTDLVEQAVKNHPAYKKKDIKYLRNAQPLGAVENWNFLLRNAKGEFLILMHHDEAPFTPNFFESLKVQTRKQNDVSVFILDCFVKRGPFGLCVRHMPRKLKKSIFEAFPLYILRRNILGPTSVLVFRRELNFEFDKNLKWLVDVDWALRLLQASGDSVKFLTDIAILSEPHSGSITKKIHSDIPTLSRGESRLIQKKINQTSVVFSMLNPNNFAGRFVSVLEFVSWRIFRIIYLAFGSVAFFLKFSRFK
jgi:glycosyltransferase involved in cell wall biosynthesis